MSLGEHRIEFVDMSNQSNEYLKELNGMELLTNESKERLLKWCSKIQIVKKNINYNPLIIDYQNEMTYRKARDEEYQFHDILERSVLRKTKIENRRNKAVLPICVSDNQANRALRIMDALIKSVDELNGHVYVESGEQDKASIRIFDQAFSFQMTEIMVKRRSLLLKAENKTMDFKPMYKQIPSGLIEIQFTEILNYRVKEKTPETISFVDSNNKLIEKQLGEIFITLCKTAIEAKAANFIADREGEKKERKQKRLRELEEDNRKILQQIEDKSRLKNNLIQNIDQQMEDWFKLQKLRKYTEELEVYASTECDESTKKLLTTYISYVRQKAESCNPVTDIINEVKAIVND